MKKLIAASQQVTPLLGILALTLLSFVPAKRLPAAPLVSDETIQTMKNLTSVSQLKNGIPVIYRQVPGSDIIHAEIKFTFGIKDLPFGRKTLTRWLWATAPRATKDFPREALYRTIERYALGIGCAPAVEYSSCSLETINDHWDQGFPLLAAIIKEPSFTEEDAALEKGKLNAELRSTPEEPQTYVNELVNKLYYPKNHPYRSTHDDALDELKVLKTKDIATLHGQMLNASLMQIVVVGSLPKERVLADLEKAFGSIPSKPVKALKIVHPPYDLKNIYRFESRPIPTAYILAKFDAPGALSKDLVAGMLMFEILDQELGEEIRTKRSLSYSVYTHALPYSIGIGMIGASTSKPKETLEAMKVVIKKFKEKTYSADELSEYKTTFSTHFFLTQETHASLAAAISRHFYFYKSVDPLYELPRLLDRVTAADIKRLANTVLTKMRAAVIFNRDKFKDEWIKEITVR